MNDRLCQYRRRTSRLLSALKLLCRDPAAFARKIRRRSYLLLQPPLKPKRVISIGSVKLELDLRDPNERSVFAELYEPREVSLLRFFLRPGQIVLDVGANIGYLSSVAADGVGPSGQVHAIEPIPLYFRRLQRLASLNPGYRIYPLDFAAGSEEGMSTISVSNDGNIGWNTLVPGFMPETQIEERVLVRIRPLDAYLQEIGLREVHFIKIDTEGFEFPVLQGLCNCLQNHRPTVLCEVAPTAYPLLGTSLLELKRFLRSYRYRITDLDRRMFEIERLERTTNVLLLPDERKVTSA